MDGFKFSLYLLFAGLCSIIISCSDNDVTLPPIENIPEPSAKVFSILYGVIQDEDSEPLQGVTVSIADETFETDENGYFRGEGFFSSSGVYIRASKEGFFDGVGMIIPYLDTSVGTNITLVRKDIEDSGSSSNRISYVKNDYSVELSENAYSLNEVNYTGNVHLASELYWPSDVNFSTIFPGFMSAQGSLETRILDAFSVLNFEIFDDYGNALDITAPAKVTMPIDPAKVSEAPNQIPMWFFDTQSGLWTQEGSAVRNGDNYEAELSHFTLWCAGMGYETLTLSGNVERDGNSYSNAIMGIDYENNWRIPFRGVGDGSYSVFVAKDFDFILDARNRCADEIYTNSFTASNSDIAHDVDIQVPINDIIISGEVSCPPDNAVSSTYVIVNYDRWHDVVIPDDNGQFTYALEDCDNAEITISAYDQLNGTRSDAQTITGSTSNVSINVCEEEFLGTVTIEMEGEETYVIKDCRLTNRTEYSQPFLGVNYRLEALDNYNGSNEYSDYFSIDIRVNDPAAELPNPTGPIIAPNMSGNVPFYYRFDPANPVVTEEDTEMVTIEVTPDFDITRIENGVELTKPGTVTFTAIKP